MRYRLEIFLCSAVVMLDQASKAAVRAAIPVNSSRTIIRGFLDLTHIRNTGMAFDTLNTRDFPFKTEIIAAVSAAVLVGVAIYAMRTAYDQLAARIGLWLIIGGALGNLSDRLTAGSVIDFIDVYWRTFHFWVFNLADAAISIGAVTLLIDTVRFRHHWPTHTPVPARAGPGRPIRPATPNREMPPRE